MRNNITSLLAGLLVILIMPACSSKVDSSKTEQSETSLETETLTIAPSPADTIVGSIAAKVETQINNTKMELNYYAPGVKDRIIWGGLVPNGKVWVTGAHMATNWEFDSDIEINKVVIPKGKYAIFTIPNKEEWTIIINKNWEQHLTDNYDEKEDVIRVNVKPLVLDQHQERLKYEINKLSKKEGELVISWDKLAVKMPFKVK